jgi:protein-disulfide isomerase
MNTTANSKKIFSWAIFIIIVALVVWGLIAAQSKANREQQAIVLPTQIATSTDHIKGNATAPITLVEYGDFQCPACAMYHPVVAKILAEYGPNSVRFVFRHFPLSGHANAFPAAQAAEAASNQGKFWEMYDALYGRYDEWVKATDPKAVFAVFAKDIGLDLVQFSADYDSDAVKEKVTNDYKGGSAGGINSTPSFFINGKKINNPDTYEEFKTIIDAGLPKLSL